MKKFYSVCRLGAVLATSAICFEATALEFEAGKLYGYVAKTGSYYMTAENFYSFDKAAPAAGTKIDNTAMVSIKPTLAGTFLENGDYIGVGASGANKIIMRLSPGTDGYWTTAKNVTASFNYVTDMANDNGTIYLWYQPSIGVWSFGSLDPETLAVTAIGSTTSTKMIALAAGDGNIFGIDTSGNFYSISKDNGQFTLIGSTGKSVSDTPQSACYDSETGKVLWARYDASSMFNKVSEIVSIDPATGIGTNIGSLTNTPQVLGLYTPVTISAEAPAAVSDLAATNQGVDNNITVTFTMPTKNNGGTDFNPNLQGLSYTIAVDGTVVVNKKASTIGEAVTETIESTPGTHTVSVFVSQTMYGDGPESKTDVFVGLDTPTAPKDVTIAANGYDVTVNWQAPDGAHGGKYDASKLSYKVVRMPDNVVVAENLAATNFAETITTETLRSYSYTVITVYEGIEGLSAQSPTVFVGPSFEVTRENPYTQDFESCSSVADAGFFFVSGSDNSTALSILSETVDESENKYLRLTCDTYTPSPKVFTTALKLKARHTYKLSMKFRTSNFYGAPFAVYLADKPTSDCNNVKTVVEQKSYGYMDQNSQQFTDDRFTPVEFQVDKTGVYFISVQHAFVNSTWDFDDIKVEDITEPGVPCSPSDFTASVGVGERDVKLSFVLPAEDNNGDDPNLTAVEIKRGDETVATLTDELVAGKTMNWIDQHAPLGNLTYSVVATNANGSSAPVQASVKVGRDYDLTVASVNAPASVIKGKPFTITATVHNNGINTAFLSGDEYSLALVRNLEGGATQVVQSQSGTQLPSDEDKVFTFDLTVPSDASDALSYYFYLTYELDEAPADNRSDNFTIDVITPELPAVSNLAAVWNDGEYDLTWSAPEFDANVVSLLGYDVYSGDVKLNGETPVIETSYSIPAETDVEYVFSVVAVYDLGNSKASDAISVQTDGINDVVADSLTVSASGSTLNITGATGTVAVYTLTGARVAEARSCGDTVSIELARGMYIVAVGGHTIKIII